VFTYNSSSSSEAAAAAEWVNWNFFAAPLFDLAVFVTPLPFGAYTLEEVSDHEA